MKKIANLKRDRDTLLALILNPHVSSAEKMAVAATIDRATRKPAEDDGFVIIKPGEIANDWRPKPEPGENTIPLNRDGSKPRMNRASVRKTMLALTIRGLNAKKGTETVTPKNGQKPYDETVWRVRPPENLAEFLAPIAFAQPTEFEPRKARAINPQCPTCHIDLQDVTIRTVTEGTCPDCGERHSESSKPRPVTPIVVIDPQRSKDNFSPVRGVNTTGDNFSPSHSPGPEPEPPWLWQGVAP